jgi:hypothetical protein
MRVSPLSCLRRRQCGGGKAFGLLAAIGLARLLAQRRFWNFSIPSGTSGWCDRKKHTEFADDTAKSRAAAGKTFIAPIASLLTIAFMQNPFPPQPAAAIDG